MELTYVRTKRS